VLRPRCTGRLKDPLQGLKRVAYEIRHHPRRVGLYWNNALAFLRLHREHFSLKAVSFAQSWEAAAAIYREFAPEVVAFSDPVAAEAFRAVINGRCHVVSGSSAAAEVAGMSVDVVLATISGSAGFPSVHAALKAGNRVALANKEALDIPSSRVNVFINPSSLLHSAASFVDGTMITLLGHNDMKNAIGYALSYPDRMHTGIDHLDLGQVRTLDFRDIAQERFPCLDLAKQAVDAGPGATMMFNAANEIAGQMFMAGRVGFYDISRIIAEGLAQDTACFDVDLDDLMDADHEAKVVASRIAE
jgi:1-deoxy-D-xylulose 5-phosphate reductoisomerase